MYQLIHTSIGRYIKPCLVDIIKPALNYVLGETPQAKFEDYDVSMVRYQNLDKNFPFKFLSHVSNVSSHFNHQLN